MRTSLFLALALSLAACTRVGPREARLATVQRAQFSDSSFVRKHCIAAEEVLAGKRDCELTDQGVPPLRLP